MLSSEAMIAHFVNAQARSRLTRRAIGFPALLAWLITGARRGGAKAVHTAVAGMYRFSSIRGDLLRQLLPFAPFRGKNSNEEERWHGVSSRTGSQQKNGKT